MERPLSDFAGYYFGGKEIWSGRFMNAYDMELLNDLVAAKGHTGVYVSYAPFPPFTSLVFAPFYAIPVATAKLLFSIISCICFVISLLRAWRYFHIPVQALLLIPLVFFLPLVNNIFFGQSYLLLFCLLLEGFMAFRKDRPAVASVFWGVAILFKLFPAVLFFYLLSAKRMKHCLYLGVSCLLLFLLSLAVNGSAVWLFYLRDILPRLNAGELNQPFTPAFQSFFMLCKNAFVRDALLNPGPAYESALLFTITTGMYKAFLLCVAFSYTVRGKGSDFSRFAVWILVSMLISPNGSTYSLVLLLIPFLALWQPGAYLPSRQWVMPIMVSVLVCLACNVPVGLFARAPLLLQFPRLFMLLALLALMFWKRNTVLHLPLLGALTVLFVLPGLLRKTQSDGSTYLLHKQQDLFLTGYTVRNGRLVCYSWDGKRNEQETDIQVNSITDKGLRLQDNQIYLGYSQLTHSGDWKRKPAIINGNTLIYLSDRDRGICFYTLRKIILPY
ncbi:hypothetical protein GCM10023092_24770 [Rurimicrobium arvi]|uniref:DUF2029 domain-containing protein n=1 Tax=Rurimicrobium arvi TaxID=2049916 RepID=A0ABP8N1J9_9BACT